MNVIVKVPPDLLKAAEKLASTRRTEVADALVALAREGAERLGLVEPFPTFTVPPGARRFGLEEVKSMEDEE
jgi:hypothetical protein